MNNEEILAESEEKIRRTEFNFRLLYYNIYII